MSDEQARALVMQVHGDIWQLGLIDNRATEAMNYKKPVIQYQQAARKYLDFTKSDLQLLKDYIAADTTIDQTHYQDAITAFELQLNAYESGLPIPQLTVEEEAGEMIEGEVELVDDGDTIFVDGKEIRFAGIDAPEKGTVRGQMAKQYLEQLVLGKRVIVRIDPYQGVELYGRVLGVVFLPDGTNVNLEMVKSCMADVNSKFGRHQYVDAEEFKQAGEACAAAFPGHGKVKVYSSKTNADIYVDGEPANMVTPAELELPVGDHEIMVVVPGFSPASRKVAVKPGKMEVKLYPIAMPAMTGMVEIISDPPGAEFVLDETPMGSTPTVVEMSSDMPHTVTFYKDGYKPDVATVVVPAGKRVKIESRMERG